MFKSNIFVEINKIFNIHKNQATKTMLDKSLSTSKLSTVSNDSFKSEKLFKDLQICCPNGNKGFGYCLDCNNSGVMCRNEEQCNCYTIHKNCQNMKRIAAFNDSIQQKLKSTKILNQISSMTQQIMDGVSKLQEDIRKRFETFGLNNADKQMSQKIYNYTKKKGTLTSEDLLKYQQEYAQQQKNWFFQQTEFFQNLIQNVIYSVSNYLKKMYKIIYYQHMQNTKNINNVIFSESQIFSKDQDNKTKLLNMLKQVGNISKAQRIYTISQHQFSLKSFYNKCFGRKRLLYVVKNQNNKIYGGYCPQQVNKNYNQYYCDNEKKSFIFDLQENIKARNIRSQKTLAIFAPGKSNNNQKNLQSKDRPFLTFGDSLNPNLIISQDSKNVPRLNYINFQSKDQNNTFYQNKKIKNNNNNNKNNYDNIYNHMYNQQRKQVFKLLQFQIFQLSFQMI